MPTLEVLCGMIGSGKSTYAIKRADEGALCVSHDDLTAMLHARYRFEPGLRELYRRMEEELARWALGSKFDVVVDRTHLTRESRERWIRFVRGLPTLGRPPVRIVAVAFPIEAAEVHARRRFESDPRGRGCGEWLKVAEHHAAQAVAEPLTLAEGFAEIRQAGGISASQPGEESP